MKSVTEELLKLVSSWNGTFKGAFNIREDGGCAGRQSTEHIKIDTKKDLPGLDIHILPGITGSTGSFWRRVPGSSTLKSTWVPATVPGSSPLTLSPSAT